MIDAVVAFTGGAVYEFGCVFWVHFSERDLALKTAAFSMLIASAEVAGIGESVRDVWCAPMFVLGYGMGTYAAVTLKAKGRLGLGTTP